MKVKNIKYYIEPKNIELVFNQGNLSDKLKAISATKTMLRDFRLWQFEKNE